MTIYFNHPVELLGDQLDDYLANGWFRMGQDIFTCRYLVSAGMLHSAVWLRRPLADHSFKGSLGKLYRKNQRLFDICVSPLTITQEKEDLYQRYRAKFKAQLSPSIRDSLYEDGRDIYNSYQVEIRKDDRLVAYSIFDIGENAIQSISGIYDPEMKRYSLGMTTILAEISYGAQQGFEHYYIGYCAPGNPDFDYKLRLDNLEFLESMGRQWLPISQLDLAELPSHRLFRAFSEVESELTKRGIPCRLRLHPAYRFIVVNKDLRGVFLGDPLFLECHPERFEDHLIYITYDLERSVYTLYIGEELPLFKLPVQLLIQNPKGPHVCSRVVKPLCPYGSSRSATEIATLLKRKEG